MTHILERWLLLFPHLPCFRDPLFSTLRYPFFCFQMCVNPLWPHQITPILHGHKLFRFIDRTNTSLHVPSMSLCIAICTFVYLQQDYNFCHCLNQGFFFTLACWLGHPSDNILRKILTEANIPIHSFTCYSCLQRTNA